MIHGTGSQRILRVTKRNSVIKETVLVSFFCMQKNIKKFIESRSTRKCKERKFGWSVNCSNKSSGRYSEKKNEPEHYHYDIRFLFIAKNKEFKIYIQPKIDIKTVPAGSVDVKFKSEFISTGINQTKHSIILEVSTSVVVLAPFYTSTETFVNSIVVAETIIVGEIPSSYYDIDGESISPLDIIE